MLVLLSVHLWFVCVIGIRVLRVVGCMLMVVPWVLVVCFEKNRGPWPTSVWRKIFGGTSISKPSGLPAAFTSVLAPKDPYLLPNLGRREEANSAASCLWGMFHGALDKLQKLQRTSSYDFTSSSKPFWVVIVLQRFRFRLLRFSLSKDDDNVVLKKHWSSSRHVSGRLRRLDLLTKDFTVGAHESLMNPDPENKDPYANLLKYD